MEEVDEEMWLRGGSKVGWKVCEMGRRACEVLVCRREGNFVVGRVAVVNFTLSFTQHHNPFPHI
jgi:hypothetical protein